MLLAQPAAPSRRRPADRGRVSTNSSWERGFQRLGDPERDSRRRARSTPRRSRATQPTSASCGRVRQSQSIVRRTSRSSAQPRARATPLSAVAAFRQRRSSLGAGGVVGAGRHPGSWPGTPFTVGGAWPARPERQLERGQRRPQRARARRSTSTRPASTCSFGRRTTRGRQARQRGLSTRASSAAGTRLPRGPLAAATSGGGSARDPIRASARSSADASGFVRPGGADGDRARARATRSRPGCARRRASRSAAPVVGCAVSGGQEEAVPPRRSRSDRTGRWSRRR